MPRFARSFLAVRRAVTGIVVLPLTMAACGGSGPPPAPLVVGAPPSPTVRFDGIVPSVSPLSGGGVAGIHGRGFLDAAGDATTTVVVGRLVAEAQVTADDLLTFVVPPAPAPDLVDVAVLLGNTVYDLPAAFEYVPDPPPPPTLSVRPEVGRFDPARGGTLIVLAVRDHGPLTGPVVTFDGVPAASLVELDAARVVAEVPPGLPPDTGVLVTLVDDGVETSAIFYHGGPLAEGDLVVNEFLADAGGLDANEDGTADRGGDEFVEIVNALDTPVDLTGLRLRDGSRTRHVFPNPTTLPTGGAIVVFGFGNPRGFAALHESGHAQVASSGGLGLNNGADTIALTSADEATTLFELSYASGDVTPGVSRNNRM
ncbi:MAG: lamin tail domain-containing protein, partial [Planctomycetota bacterium]